MWLLYFVNAFQSSITGNLSAYVTSGFESHSLIPTISVVSSVMSAATYMPLAKILNLWDRSIGFLVMVLFSILGLVLSATCSNIATYCAAQVGQVLILHTRKKTYHPKGVLQYRLCRFNFQYRCYHS